MPVKILVADDSVTMRRVLELTFGGEDAQVTGVDSGDAAIARAAELRPDVVFADVSMAADAYKVAATIKSTPGLEQTAVIALASQKSPYDEAKGRASGVDDHVLKPFDTQILLDKVKQVLARPRVAVTAKPAMAGAAAPAAPGARPSVAQEVPMRTSKTGTMAFGGMQAPAAPAARPMAAPAAPVARPAAAAPAVVSNAARGATNELSAKLDGMGLTSEQVAGVLALTRDVVERVVWEVVPELAETIIKEEIRRLTAQ